MLFIYLHTAAPHRDLFFTEVVKSDVSRNFDMTCRWISVGHETKSQ